MIFNKTKKVTLSKEEIICKTWPNQARGLMFRQRQNLIMVFPEERKVQLHNFFVFYPLEILLLDKNFQVIELKKSFWPFTFWNSTRKGKYLIELGQNHSKNKTTLNDFLIYSR